jgi:hypothetical protein
MENVEPYVLDSESEIVEFLNFLNSKGRIHSASDYLPRVPTAKLKEFFNQKVKELSSDT